MTEFEPRIIVFACNWCTYAAADIAGTSRIQYPPNVRIIRVMCSGMVAPEHISLALESGADGILVAGCHPGDCHYKEGNTQALKRYTMIKTTLSAFGIEENRLALDWISAGEQDKFVQVVTEMTERIRKLGPLPR